MSIKESITSKLKTVSENVPKVYEAGKAVGRKEGEQAEYDRFWDIYQQKGGAFMHHGLFSGSGWNDDTFYPKYNIHMRYGCKNAFFFNHVSDLVARLNECGITLETREANDLSSAFNSMKTKTLPAIDTTGAESATASLFAGSSLLETIEKITVVKENTHSNWFGGCSALKNVVFEGEIGNSLDLRSCTALSKASILSVLGALSGDVTGKTLTLSKAAVDTAFESSAGAGDGSLTEAWFFAQLEPSDTWTITLS